MGGIREEMARKLVEGEVHDPFTRRKTQPKIAQVKKEAPAVVNPVAVEASKDEEAKKENKPLIDDLFSSHNFDVDIDLNVASPNNATNVNVKPVVHAKKDNGPKKSLNLADYKKKRGLI